MGLSSLAFPSEEQHRLHHLPPKGSRFSLAERLAPANSTGRRGDSSLLPTSRGLREAGQGGAGGLGGVWAHLCWAAGKEPTWGTRSPRELVHW